MKPCLFFDRDGVVNRSPGPGYVLRWEDFEFQDGIFDLISLVKSHGWLAVLITSQKGVGKGEMFHVELDRIHDEMQKRIAAECGSGFDAIYAHTGLPEDPHPAKPDPGMILSAASDHDIDLSRSWMIGDADRDIEMAQRSSLEGAIRLVGDKALGIEASETVANLREAREVFERMVS
jgi:D-glycero-D-manno-heptose 1,7-bisphosphate phosphatase